MASKSYGWDVRNIAKISPKMAKKQPFFDFFRFSQKLSIRFERNFLQSFYTVLWSFMCNFIKFVLLRCEKQAKFSPKMAKKQSFFVFSIFSQTVHTIRTNASQKEKDLSRLLYRICGSGFSPDLFMKITNFSKTVHTIFTKFCTVILHPKGPLRVQRHQNCMAGI